MAKAGGMGRFLNSLVPSGRIPSVAAKLPRKLPKVFAGHTTERKSGRRKHRGK